MGIASSAAMQRFRDTITDKAVREHATAFRDAVFDLWFPGAIALAAFWFLALPGLPHAQVREALLTYALRTSFIGIWMPLFASAVATTVFAMTLSSWSVRLLQHDTTDDDITPMSASRIAVGLGTLPVLGFCLCALSVASDPQARITAVALALIAAAGGLTCQIAYLKLLATKGNVVVKRTLRWLPFALFVVFVLGFGFTTGSRTLHGVAVARALGPIAIFGFSLSFITAAGCGVLAVGRDRKIPLFAILAGMAVAFNYFDINDNHQIGLLPNPGHLVSQPVETAYKKWSALHPTDPRRPEPIILVAAEGGGIRAAYVTGAVLSIIADRCPEAANRIFAVSSVSGGSIGAAIYAAVMHTHPLDARDRRCDFLDISHTYYQAQILRILGRDHISPLVGKVFFSEVAQALLPFPVRSFDRQEGLNSSLKSDFRDVVGSDDIELPTLQMVPTPQAPSVPYLLMNMTRVNDGYHVTAGSLDIHTYDTDEIDYSTADYSLLDIATTSARYPFVSPPGYLTVTGANVRALFLDGGIYDNSGLLGVTGIYKRLLALRRGDQPILILNVSNHATCLDEINDVAGHACTPMKDPHALHALEDPATALFRAQGQHTQLYKSQLAELIKSEDAGRNGRRPDMMVTAGLSSDLPTIVLGWMLSPDSVHQMDTQLSMKPPRHCITQPALPAGYSVEPATGKSNIVPNACFFQILQQQIHGG
jgi:predicted acylesterase/phospholipase RssA